MRGTILLVTLLIAQPVEAQPRAVDRLGEIAPAPREVVSEPVRVRNQLDILQAAIESYRGSHWWRYPEARSLIELVDKLKRLDKLPDTYQAIEAREFRADRHGYKIIAQAGDQEITIETPERYDPFWIYFWWL